MRAPRPTRLPRAVVFDMDGLMLDTESINRMAWQGAAVDLGYTLDDEFYLTLLGRTTVDCEARVQQQCGAAFPMDEFRTRRRALWRRAVASAGADPDAVDVHALGDRFRLSSSQIADAARTAAVAARLRAAGAHTSADDDIRANGDRPGPTPIAGLPEGGSAVRSAERGAGRWVEICRVGR